MIAEMVKSATPTERMVAALLLENTGSAMMDSGGAYGRAWQRTRAAYGLDGGLPNSAWSGGPGHPAAEPKDDDIERVALTMRDEERAYIDSYGDITVNTFHWLVERLEYIPELHEKYERWQRVTNFGKDRWDKDWGMPLMERYIEQLRKHGRVTGLYGDGEPLTVNTYNGEDALGRTLQYTMFSFESTRDHEILPDNTYVLLQVHGGADVRGGYTDPRLFVVCGGTDEGCLFDNAETYVWCDGVDRVANGQIEGQVGMDGEIATMEHTDSHRWDNTYGDGKLRADDDYNTSGVLVFRRDDEEMSEEVCIEHGYTTPEGKVIRPDRFAPANNSTWDDEGKFWRCPVDGAPLHASGAWA